MPIYNDNQFFDEIENILQSLREERKLDENKEEKSDEQPVNGETR